MILMKKTLLAGAIVMMMSIDILYGQKFAGLALTPPMGWNSWNKFGCEISESLIREVADSLVSSGLRDAGYNFIVIDDCWQIGRDSTGTIQADPKRFPSGMKKLGEYIHSRGLKFGINSDAGTSTCQGRPGSRGYEFQDARTYASWGVDYLKYDWCAHGKQNAEASYTTMRNALYKAGRPVVYSICEWGTNKPWEWGKDIGHLWRATEDIINCFDCKNYWGGLGVIQIIDLMADLGNYTGPEHWNDADMLEIGNSVLTPDEERLHLSMWAMFSSPLMAGNDLRNMSKETAAILCNREVIPIDQDLKTTIKKVYTIDDSFTIRDLWEHQVPGTTKDNLKGTLEPHDVMMIRLLKNTAVVKQIPQNDFKTKLIEYEKTFIAYLSGNNRADRLCAGFRLE
jgi:alpha-galactosidase